MPQEKLTLQDLNELAQQKLSPQDLALLTPEERKIVDSFQSGGGYLNKQTGNMSTSYPAAVLDRFKGLVTDNVTNHPGRTAAAVGGAAAMGAGAAGLASGLAGKVIPYGKQAGQGLAWGLGSMGAAEILKKMGMPTSMAEMIPMMILMGKGGGAAAEGAAAEEAAGLKSIPPGNMSRGRTLDPLQAEPGGEIFERVTKGGVQNDFRGRVSIKKPTSLQAPNEDDVMENVLGTSRKNYSNPTHEHDDLEYPSDVSDLQKILSDFLNKKKTTGALKRRNP
jgi:hypothetical protein